MKRIAKPAFIALFASLLAFGQSTEIKDPAILLQRAKVLLNPGPARTSDVIRLQVIPLLRQANAIWDRSLSDDPQYAESLDLLAILLRGYESNWRDEAAPLVSRALEIIEAEVSSQPSADLALALELQADVLGHEQPGASAGAPFWNRASRIRSQLVAAG